MQRNVTRAPRCSLLAFLCALSSGPVATPPCLPRPWHMLWQVVSGAVLALLRLDGLIVHVHVVLDGGHVLVTQQLLQAEGIVAQHQVADSERVAQNVRADAFASDTGALSDALEEQCHPVFCERGARLGEEEVVLPCAAPLGQFL